MKKVEKDVNSSVNESKKGENEIFKNELLKDFYM